jgi:hypothetical protein
MNALAKNEFFQTVINYFSYVVGINKTLSIIEKVQLLPTKSVYSLFQWLYEESSVVWMTLGLRSSLHNFTLYELLLSDMNKKLLIDIIKLIILFINNIDYNILLILQLLTTERNINKCKINMYMCDFDGDFKNTLISHQHNKTMDWMWRKECLYYQKIKFII